MSAQTDEQLKGKTVEFKVRLAKRKSLDDILPEAFTVCREADWCVFGMKPFQVQVIGGIALHRFSSVTLPEVEYVQRKSLCKLIYKKFEDTSLLTNEQYDAVIKEDPFLGELYALVKEFHRIVFSRKPNEIDNWISNAQLLGIPELNTYLGGLTNDILAV